MGHEARKARKKAGEKFEHEPKRPTKRYLTKQEKQEARRRRRRADQAIERGMAGIVDKLEARLKEMGK